MLIYEFISEAAEMAKPSRCTTVTGGLFTPGVEGGLVLAGGLGDLCAHGVVLGFKLEGFRRRFVRDREHIEQSERKVQQRT